MAQEHSNQSGNQTPGTPGFRESELYDMSIDELREKARQEGVSNAEQMHEDQLIEAIKSRHG